MFKYGRKVVEAAAKRLAPKGGTASFRPDIAMSDHQPLTKNSSRMMLCWASHLEQPSLSALEGWVLANLNNVQMEHDTLRWYPKAAAASMVVSWMLPTRKLADADKMIRVAPGRFMEGSKDNTNEPKVTWEVRESNGEKFLVKVVKDNLDELLAERKSEAFSKAPTFTSVKEAGIVDVTSGDEVRFYHKGNVKIGRVVRQDADKWVVSSGKETCRVAAGAIVEVVTKDPKTVQDYKDRERDYHKKIFPKSYLDKYLKE